MIEIIILIFITREIGRLAFSKGLNPAKWKFFTVIAWIVTEFFGIIGGFMIFGKDNLISVALIGFAFAITSYFFIKAHLNKLPDHDLDDEIHHLGR